MRTGIKDMTLVVGYTPDGGGIKWLLCAATIEELREAWNSISGNTVAMDESLVFRVAYSKCERVSLDEIK